MQTSSMFSRAQAADAQRCSEVVRIKLAIIHTAYVRQEAERQAKLQEERAVKLQQELMLKVVSERVVRVRG